MRIARQPVATWITLAVVAALVPVAWVNGSARLDAAYGVGARVGARSPGIGQDIAASEVAAGKSRMQEAIRDAARAVAKAPVDAAAVRTLGVHLLTAGSPDKAEALLRAAGGMGWYDPPTQLIWANVAFAAGDREVAIQRLDAAMRITQGREPMVSDAMRRIEQTPGGLQMVADRLATGDDWRQPYLNETGPLPTAALKGRVELIRLLHRRGIPLTPEGSLLIQTQLAGRMEYDLARQVWALTSPFGKTRAVINDPDLTGTGNSQKPAIFDWTFPGAAGLNVAVERAPAPLGRRVARVRTQGQTSIPFAVQTIKLSPGAHVLEATVIGAKTATPLLAELQCWPQSLTVEGAAEPGKTVFRHRFEVPVGCYQQELRLSVSGPEARAGADFHIGALRINP